MTNPLRSSTLANLGVWHRLQEARLLQLTLPHLYPNEHTCIIIAAHKRAALPVSSTEQAVALLGNVFPDRCSSRHTPCRSRAGWRQ